MCFEDKLEKTRTLQEEPHEEPILQQQQQQELVQVPREQNVQPVVNDVQLVRNIRQDLTLQAREQQDVDEVRTLELTSLQASLTSYKRASIFGKDSPEYTQVKTQLGAVIALHGKAFTTVPADNMQLALQAMDGYAALIAACDVYLLKGAGQSFKGRFSSVGRQRQDMVDTIRDFAKRDLGFLRENSERIRTATGGLSWGNVLQEARAEKYTLTGDFDQLKTIGGNASKNYILPGDPPTFLKEAETLTTKNLSGNTAEQKAVYLSLAKQQGLDPELAERLFGQRPSQYSKSEVLTPQEWAQHHDTIAKMSKLLDMQISVSGQTGIMQIPVGAEVKISLRNVATTRMSDLLGIDSVARSKTMRVTDRTGKVKEGNGMEGAPGIPFTEEKFLHGSDQQGTYDMRVIRQLADMQVLDTLIGQVDRNDGNILVEHDQTGKVIGVKGIDNDFCFPHTGTLRQLNSPQKPTFGKQKSDEDRPIAIPHMSMSVAQRLMDLTEDTLRMALSDVLEPTAIDFTWKRIALAQSIVGPRLKAQLEHPSESKQERIFLYENEWDEEAAQDFDREKDIGMLDMEHDSYVGSFLRSMRGEIAIAAGKPIRKTRQGMEELKAIQVQKERQVKEMWERKVAWSALGRTDQVPSSWKIGTPPPPPVD